MNDPENPDLIICAICCDFPNELYQSRCGHSICEKCKPKLEVEGVNNRTGRFNCPSCRGHALIGQYTPNVAFNALILPANTICPHETCGKPFKEKSEFLHHKVVCVHGGVKCILCPITATNLSMNDFVPHLVSCHDSIIQSVCGNEDDFKLIVKRYEGTGKWGMVCEQFGEQFVVFGQYCAPKNQDAYKFVVFFCGSKEEGDKFEYELSLFTFDEKLKMCVQATPVPICGGLINAEKRKNYLLVEAQNTENFCMNDTFKVHIAIRKKAPNDTPSQLLMEQDFVSETKAQARELARQKRLTTDMTADWKCQKCPYSNFSNKKYCHNPNCKAVKQFFGQSRFVQMPKLPYKCFLGSSKMP